MFRLITLCHFTREFSEANGERAAEVPVHQEGEEKLVPDRPHRQIQKVEVAAQRGVRNGEREFGLVSLRLYFFSLRLDRDIVHANCKPQTR